MYILWYFSTCSLVGNYIYGSWMPFPITVLIFTFFLGTSPYLLRKNVPGTLNLFNHNLNFNNGLYNLKMIYNCIIY